MTVSVYLMQYPLSTWKMQMRFKFGSSVQAACIYPTATLQLVTNGNMCSFYFYKAGRTRGWRAKLVGFEISFSRGLAAVWNDSNTQWQLHGKCPDPPRCFTPRRPWGWVNGPASPFHSARGRQTRGHQRTLRTVAGLPVSPSCWLAHISVLAGLSLSQC